MKVSNLASSEAHLWPAHPVTSHHVLLLIIYRFLPSLWPFHFNSSFNHLNIPINLYFSPTYGGSAPWKHQNTAGCVGLEDNVFLCKQAALKWVGRAGAVRDKPFQPCWTNPRCCCWDRRSWGWGAAWCSGVLSESQLCRSSTSPLARQALPSLTLSCRRHRSQLITT